MSSLQRNANSLPATVKPSLPAPFTGRMDGVSVNRFVDQLDNYFGIVELSDDVKMEQIAITLLEGTPYSWFAV